jgi:ABC-type nickel/cobalt efflux system permease component RcnA
MNTEFYNSIIKHLTTWQYQLNSYISTHIRAIDDEGSIMMSLMVLGIAFIYGLIHAAGPGHGKAIVGFYFSGKKEQNRAKRNYLEAFEMGYMIAIVHTISALITTFGLYFIIKKMFYKNFHETYAQIMHISAMMIMIVGAFIIYEAYKNRKNHEKNISQNSKSKYAIAFSAGIVPCPGVMTIVLFSVMQKKFILGILSAIAMSIGMGLTISVVGILGILFNKQTNNFSSKVGYVLQMMSGVIIILLGVFLFSH